MWRMTKSQYKIVCILAYIEITNQKIYEFCTVHYLEICHFYTDGPEFRIHYLDTIRSHHYLHLFFFSKVLGTSKYRFQREFKIGLHGSVLQIDAIGRATPS
jgi:hypothetical protein